jgi:hypothetical protein
VRPSLVLCLAVGLGFTSETRAEVVIAWQVSPAIDEPSINYGVDAGWRRGRWAARVRIEHSVWWQFDSRAGLHGGTLDLALGGELLSFERRMSTAIYAGTATLLERTLLDDAGATGLFLDLQPAAFRWRRKSGVWIRVVPLHVAIVAPVLSGIPLLQVQYRTSFGFEWSL